MSPRRNRPPRRWLTGRPDRGGPAAPAELDLARAQRGTDAVETWGGEQWRVRQIPGSAATKTYLCPGCHQEIRPGTPHLVAWPLDDLDARGPGGLAGFGEAAERRHWHSGCWRARAHRRPSR